MVIAVDFDGTIVRGTFPKIDGLTPDAKLYMDSIKKAGHYIIINTCRSGELLIDAVNYLIEKQIPFDRVNDNHPENIRKYNGNTRKIFADIYIDDQNLGGFPGWAYAYEAILEHKVKPENVLKTA